MSYPPRRLVFYVMFYVRKISQTDQEVLQFGLQLLSRIGLWGERKRRIRFFGVVLYFLTILIIPKVVLGSGKDGFDSFARNIAELIFFTEVCLSIGIFAARREPFEKLVALLKRTIKRHDTQQCLEEIRVFNRRMDIFSRTYEAYIRFLVLLYLGIPLVVTVVKYIFTRNGERSDFMLVLEIQFYWLDIRRNIIHYTIYMVFCFIATLCSSYLSILKGSVILVIIQYGTKLFELVSIKINTLGEVENDDERRKQLREVVELHQMALQYAKYLEDVVNFILINQILNCILIWCLMMFYISTNFGPNAVNIIELFIVLMGEMVVYCVNGTNLSEKAAAVGHAMYHYPWYHEPIDMQKAMRMVIQRAQRPTGITAAKFYFVNIERLGLVVQASYSYYLILKNNF